MQYQRDTLDMLGFLFMLTLKSSLLCDSISEKLCFEKEETSVLP